MGLTERMSELRSGYSVNCTEGKPALHHLLRMPRGYFRDSGRVNLMGGCGQDRLEEVWKMIGRISSYSSSVRDGTRRGITGKPFKNVLCITGCGMHYGTEAVYEALRADRDAVEATKGRGTTLSFVNNVDPVDFDIKTRHLDARETLFIVISKNFDSMSTMYNTRMARRWLYKSLSEGGDIKFSDVEMVEKHFCAVTADYNQAVKVSEAYLRIYIEMIISEPLKYTSLTPPL